MYKPVAFVRFFCTRVQDLKIRERSERRNSFIKSRHDVWWSWLSNEAIVVVPDTPRKKKGLLKQNDS